MEWLSDPQIWMALLTLTSLEIVLGIDNVIFISILAGKLPTAEQGRARSIGMILAMVMILMMVIAVLGVMAINTSTIDIQIFGNQKRSTESLAPNRRTRFEPEVSQTRLPAATQRPSAETVIWRGVSPPVLQVATSAPGSRFHR